VTFPASLALAGGSQVRSTEGASKCTTVLRFRTGSGSRAARREPTETHLQNTTSFFLLNYTKLHETILHICTYNIKDNIISVWTLYKTVLTNMCCHFLPFPCSVRISSPHFKVVFQQGLEFQASSKDNTCCGSTHSLFMVNISIRFETDIVFGDTVFALSRAVWRAPAECHRRLVFVHSCFQVLNWAWSESWIKSLNHC